MIKGKKKLCHPLHTCTVIVVRVLSDEWMTASTNAEKLNVFSWGLEGNSQAEWDFTISKLHFSSIKSHWSQLSSSPSGLEWNHSEMLEYFETTLEKSPLDWCWECMGERVIFSSDCFGAGFILLKLQSVNFSDKICGTISGYWIAVEGLVPGLRSIATFNTRSYVNFFFSSDVIQISNLHARE